MQKSVTGQLLLVYSWENSLGEQGWVVRAEAWKFLIHTHMLGQRWDMTHGSLSKEDTMFTHRERSRQVVMTMDLHGASATRFWRRLLNVLFISEGQDMPASCTIYAPGHILVSPHSEQRLPHNMWCISPDHFYKSLAFTPNCYSAKGQGHFLA